jgi:alkylation response protein AidB-like acyl-CoA dehydrogenase
MANDPIGIALNVLNRFAGSEAAEKLGLRKPAERLAYQATRSGFAAAGAAARQFKAVQKLLQPERLPKPESIPDLFDLTESEQQQMFRETLHTFADEVMRPAAYDADVACAAPAELLASFNELGITQFAVPEALGGAATEQSPVTNVLIAEELARGDMGLAVAALAPIGVANALVRWGSADQQAKYLPAFAQETPPIAAIAIAEPRALFEPGAMACRATSKGDGYVLNGVKSLVPLGRSADFFLVAAELDTKGPQLFFVRPDLPGVTIEAEPAMGIRAASTCRLTFADTPLGAADLLGERVGGCNFQELIDLARIAWCGLAIGTAQAVLDLVIPYCNDRIAFGEPITNRQSVAFMIANIAIELDGMKLLTYRAASRAEQGLPFHREAYLARLQCAEKGMEIGTNGVQLLGGHGFVKEYPVERWYRDLRIIGVAEGGLLA